MAHIKIVGMEDLQRKLTEGNKRVDKAARRAVTHLTNDLGRLSAELVPFDTGNLKRSRVQVYPKPSGKIDGLVGYGGSAAPYALVQHEMTEWWHPPKPPGKSKVGKKQGTGPVQPGTGRGPKFLEYPAKQLARNFDEVIVKEVRKQLRGWKG